MSTVKPLVYRVLTGKGLSSIRAQNLKAPQILHALKKAQRIGAGHVLNMTVKTDVQELSLHRLNLKPHPFYTISSDRPVTFYEFMDLTASLSDRLLKSWIVYEGVDGIEQEITLSNNGISINGRIIPQVDLGAAIVTAHKCVASPMKTRTYWIGKDVGALLLGEPQEHGVEIEVVPEVAGLSFLSQARGVDNYVKGAISQASFKAAVSHLLGSPNFLSLEIIQPVLSVLVRRAHIYATAAAGVFRWDCSVSLARSEILQNLRAGLL
jgi:hypothetical protein